MPTTHKGPSFSGAKLRAARRSKGWTADTLGMMTGLTESGICYLEGRHRRDPRVSTVIRLARALGLRIEDLLE